jgi:hypothetical protein
MAGGISTRRYVHETCTLCRPGKFVSPVVFRLAGEQGTSLEQGCSYN